MLAALYTALSFLLRSVVMKFGIMFALFNAVQFKTRFWAVRGWPQAAILSVFPH